MVGAVIFDMDTLLDLGALSTERRRARWSEMRKRLDEVVPYEPPEGSAPALELTRRVHEQGVKVGILTDLPGPIAKGLAEKFRTSCNKLIDASEGLPIGPDPAGVEAMCERLGVPAKTTLVVGGSMPFIGAAANAGARSAGVAWAGAGLDGWGGWQPDIRVRTPGDLVNASAAGAAMGAVAEVLAAGETPVIHWGSLIAVADGVFAAGRYFTSTDLRLAAHKLSGLIIASKANLKAANRLGAIMAEVASQTNLLEADLVVAVPGSPDAAFERLGPARVGIARALGARDGRRALTMTKTCENYLDLDRDQRRMANQGRFQAPRKLEGERVLLIDAVMTTGAMTRACARELLAAGAGEVSTLVAGVSQDALQRQCPRCGEGMMRRTFGRFGPLYACTKRSCDYTERWDG